MDHVVRERLDKQYNDVFLEYKCSNTATICLNLSSECIVISKEDCKVRGNVKCIIIWQFH